MKTRRRRVRLMALLLAAIVSFALGGCGSASSATRDDGIVKVAVFPSLNALGAHTAELRGIFDKVGLKVEFVTTATPAEGFPQLVGEDIDFALMDVSTPMIARSQGMPIVMVAPGASGTALNEKGLGVGNFWVRKDSDIKTVKDFERAKFGIPQTKSQLWIDVRTTVDQAGGDSSRTQFIEVPNSLAALKSGSVDVVTTAEPAGAKALKDPEVRHLAGFVSGAVGQLAYAYVATEKTTQADPEMVRKFRTAILEANRLLNADPSVAPEIAGTYVKAPPPVLKKAIYQKFDEAPIDSADLAVTRDRLLRYGLIDADDAPAPEEMLADH